MGKAKEGRGKAKDAGAAGSERGAKGSPRGVASDGQPDLVSPSALNMGDHGAADDKPMAGDALNFDDEEMGRERGRVAGGGGTWDQKRPSDAGRVGVAPGAGLSDRNGPSERGSKSN